MKNFIFEGFSLQKSRDHHKIKPTENLFKNKRKGQDGF